MATKRAGRAVSAEVVSVTPAKAREWLENNHVNRSLRRKVVAAYRRDMEEGRWTFTGEPVQISRSGALLNGQHRLTALAEANIRGGIDMLVVTGLADESGTLMDQGVPRNIRDALIMEHGHIKNSAYVSSICRWLVLNPEMGPQMTPGSMSGKVTASEALEVFNQAPALIIEAGERAGNLYPYLMASPSGLGYCWVQFSRIDHSATEDFFEGMRNMEWSLAFGTNDPRKAALRRLHAMRGDEEIKTGLMAGVMVVSLLSRAWNSWRKGEEVEVLAIRKGGGIIPPATPV